MEEITNKQKLATVGYVEAILHKLQDWMPFKRKNGGILQDSRDDNGEQTLQTTNTGEIALGKYNKSEIDYFIGTDIETEDLYIVPIDFIMKYSSSIGIKALEPYKNNFTQLEPQIGNSLSGCDDIGETLTGNTEGIK